MGENNSYLNRNLVLTLRLNLITVKRMREKKSWRKNTLHQNEDVKLTLEVKHDEEERLASIGKLTNA